MNTMLNKGLSAILVLVAAVLAMSAFAPAAVAADQGMPFGVIDSERIVNEYGAAKDAQEQYQQFLNSLEKDIKDRQQDFQRMVEEFESQKLLLGEDALAARYGELENMRNELFEYSKSADSKAEAEYKAKIQPIVDQVKTITERIGKEEGWGIIIDSAALTTIYVDDAVDLTDKVLSALVSGGE